VEGTSGRHEPFSFHEAMVKATLAASSHRRTARTPRARTSAALEERWRQGEGSAAIRWKRERRQRCQRLDRSRRRGRNTPTLSYSCPGHGAMIPRGKLAARVCLVIRRSVHGCREALGPPVSRAKPKTSRDVHAVQAAERTGNARSTGARRSFRWQKSVGRIARLVHREFARARGGKEQGASQKEARRTPDAGPEPRDGETVRGKALAIKSLHLVGLGVSARRFSIRRKVLSGCCPSYLHR